MKKKTTKNKKMSFKRLIGLITIICIFVLILVFIEINIYKREKIDDTFALTKELYKVNGADNQLILNADIKNETDKDQHIDSIEIKAIDKDNKEVFFYYKKVNKNIDKKDTYTLIINDSIDNENIKNKKDIKDIVYKINK